MPDQPCPYDGPLHPMWEPDPEEPEQGLWVFEVSKLTAMQLGDLLRVFARGTYAWEAAVELLIAHRHWLSSTAFRAHVSAFLGYSGSSDVPMASITWLPLIGALDRGEMYASSSEDAILRIAAALAGRGFAVDLGAALSRLDEANTRLVVRAIQHAAGDRQEWPS